LTGSAAGARTETPNLARVRDLVGYLYKAVKTILLYPPTNSLPGEFKKGLYQKLISFLDEFGPLTLTVRGDQFAYEGETVHEEAGGEDNFIATLTRDGIQKLIFLPGIPFEELDRFLGIVKHVINERSEDDDLVTLLWEAALVCIRYEAISELETLDYGVIEKRLLEREVEMAERTGQIDYSAIVLEESSLAEQATAGAQASPDDAKSRQVDSVDGKCVPRSPAPMAPRSASPTAWARTSASECPSRPRSWEISTPPKTRRRPASSQPSGSRVVTAPR